MTSDNAPVLNGEQYTLGKTELIENKPKKTAREWAKKAIEDMTSVTVEVIMHKDELKKYQESADKAGTSVHRLLENRIMLAMLRGDI